MVEDWETRELADKGEILSYLESDRLYGAYAIGDLEPELFAQSRWVGAEKARQLRALILHFRGLKLPALFMMGDVEGLQAILGDALRPEQVVYGNSSPRSELVDKQGCFANIDKRIVDVIPISAYLTCRRQHLRMVCGFYDFPEPVAMWRMVLNQERFTGPTRDCMQLTTEHSDRLSGLYAYGGGIGFSTAQLKNGVFRGLFVDNRLVAVAGTHFVSATYGVAAVGNVLTLPDYRGQGYGTATISAVVADLVELGIRDIVLNVSQGNAPAIRIYGKLGFYPYCTFLEGRACVLASGEQQPAV